MAVGVDIEYNVGFYTRKGISPPAFPRDLRPTPCPLRFKDHLSATSRHVLESQIPPVASLSMGLDWYRHVEGVPAFAARGSGADALFEPGHNDGQFDNTFFILYIGFHGEEPN